MQMQGEIYPPTPWGPVCGSLVYLPPIVLPPRRAENLGHVGFLGGGCTSSLGPSWLNFRWWALLGSVQACLEDFLIARLALVTDFFRFFVDLGKISDLKGVGGMAEPIKSAAPLSVPRRVKSI